MPKTGPIDGVIGWAITQSSISKNHSQKQKRSISQNLKSFHVFSLGVRRVSDPHSLQALKVSSFHGLISQIHFLQVPYATYLSVLRFINTLGHIFLHSVNQTNNGLEN